MDVSREQIVEAAVSVFAVGVLFAVLYWVGANYNTNGGLSATGGELLVYAIVGFVLLMAAVGAALAFGVAGAED